jgi:excisionase family DNA binding protein
MQTIFTTLQVSELLKCHKQTVEDLLRRGELPGIKIGRAWLVPSDALNLRLTELALSESESRRNRHTTPTQPLALLLSTESRRGRQRAVPPKLPDLKDFEKALGKR